MKTETSVGIFVIISIGIFFYLSLNIGALRLDQRQYYIYKTYFDNTGGLDEKSPVKIAGVEVGWIESINLLEGGKAEVNMRIHKRNRLARNAYATIQQEGLIGTKNIEIEPGDLTTGTLPPGSVLAMPGRPPTSVGDLLEQFKDIAASIQDVVTSFKNTFGTRQGEENLRVALNSVAQASSRIAQFSEILERSLQKNEENINGILQDFRKTAGHLDHGIPIITDDFHAMKLAFADQALPELTNAGKKAGSAFESLDTTAVQARDAFHEAGQVAEKINSGKGVLGKLITDDETYGDLKKTVRGFKEMVNKSQTLDIQVDMHTESMFKTGNSKGYFDVKLRPLNDYFYLVQLASSEQGRVTKQEKYYKRYDDEGNLLKVDPANPQPYEINYLKLDYPNHEEIITRVKNDILFGFQFGKRFNRVALRIGLFESSFGFGVDYYVPLNTDMFHWITTLEAFDFSGANRIDSKRLHVKWLNKLFFMRNVYTTFGVDDIYSKDNASPFIGGGFRFGDDDIKYLLSYLPVGGIKEKNS